MPAIDIFFIALAVVLSAGLVWAQYYFRRKTTFPMALAALRFITYVCICLLLINPKINHKSVQIEKPTLAVLVDNSRSIKEFGEEKTIRDLVDKLQNQPEIKEAFHMDVYTFGEALRKQDTFDFGEGQTEIGRAFQELQKLYRKQTVPTIIMSDGNQTLGRNYTYGAQTYGQDIYPIVIGDTTQYADLRIDQVNVNRFAFLNNKFPVEVFVNYSGNQAVQTQFSIQQEGRTLFQKELKFTAAQKSAIVHANLEADAVGVQNYKINVDPFPQEKNTDNNQRNFAVEVVDQSSKILLYSSFSHPDLGALKKSIETHQEREVDIHYTDDKDIDFADYQLVILYQPTAEFSQAFQKTKDLKINTLLITGTQTDYNFLNQVQDFFHKNATSQTEEFLPDFNADYPAFQMEDIGFDHYPPLLDQFGDLSIKADLKPLLYQNIQGYQTDVPLMATLEENGQKSGFIFGENIWQWRNKAFRDKEDFEDFDHFINQLIQYLSSQKKRKRLVLDYQSFYNTGQSILFRAEYFDQTYQFDPRAKIKAQITERESHQSTSYSFLLNAHHYELDLSHLKPGEYDFQIEVEGTGITEKGHFNIIDFDIEKQFLNADVGGLQKIGKDQKVYFPDQAETLIAELLQNPIYKPTQKSVSTVSSLIDWYYLLWIILLCLSAEWLLRKYRGFI